MGVRGEPEQIRAALLGDAEEYLDEPSDRNRKRIALLHLSRVCFNIRYTFMRS